jgi:polar amino acid transport system substrate-binding protein
MRKIVAAALAVGMAAMTVTGCSSQKSASKETTKTTTEASKETEKATEKQTEKETEKAAEKETEKDTEAASTEEKTEEASSKADEAKSESTEDKKTFTVGFDAEFPPYGYRDESGEYVGFDLDLAAEVCDRQGWELVKQPIDWDSKDMELSSGAIDCIWNGFTMNGREDAYTWSDPYIDNSQVFVVAADSGIENKSDLAGKVVAVQKDSSALAALNDEENKDNIALRDSVSQLIEYADYNTAFMDLEQGAVEAVAIDIGVAQYQIDKREEGAYVMLEGDDNKLASEQYAIGFKKGNDELRDAVQDTLDEMVKDGTFAKIAEEWGLTDSVCLGK